MVPEAYLPAMLRVKQLWFHREDVWAEAWTTWDQGTPPARKMAYAPKKYPITLDILYRHCVLKMITVGAYQFRSDGTVRWICWDVDDDLHREDRSHVQSVTLQVLQTLRGLGLDPSVLIEDSGSKGYHLWLFLQEPVDGKIAQGLGLYVRDQTDIPEGIHIEVFPKNEQQAPFGNLVKIPFSVHPKTGRHCQLVDAGFVPRDSVPAIDGVRPLGGDELAVLVADLGLDVRSASGWEGNAADAGIPRTAGHGLPCTTELLNTGVAQGERQEATFRLAYRLRSQGLPDDVVDTVLLGWDTGKNTPPLSTSDPAEFKRAQQQGFKAKGLGCKSDFMRQHCHATCPVYQKIYSPGDGPDASNDPRGVASGIIQVPGKVTGAAPQADKAQESGAGPGDSSTAPGPTADSATLLELRYIRSDPDKGLLFQRDGLEYWVQGKLERARVDILRDGRKIGGDDRINLSQSRARQFLAKQLIQVAKDLTIEALLNDLVLLDDLYRVELKRAAGIPIEERTRVRASVTPEEEAAATALLKSPDLLHKIHQAIEAMGVAGEWENRLTLYLAYTSRLSTDPIQVTVKGASSSGKSWMAGRVLKLMPEGSYNELTDSTPQALLYLDEDKDLRHRILVFFELQGGEKSDYKIRTLQSEGVLKLWVPIKDPSTNDIKTVEKVVPGPVQITTTTTEFLIHAENETRNLSLYASDSKDLTRKVRDKTAAKWKGGRLSLSERDLAVWHAAQTILKAYPVLIPYVDALADVFPLEPVRVRRDYARFLELIGIITLLHQFQREHREVDGKPHLVADLVDYEYARILAGKIFENSMTGVSPKAREWAEWLSTTPPYSAGHEFIAHDIATVMKTSDDTARRVLNQLSSAGGVNRKVPPGGGGRGVVTRYTYVGQPPDSPFQLPPAVELAAKAGGVGNPAVLIHPFSGEISELGEEEPQNRTPKKTEVKLPSLAEMVHQALNP